MQQARSRRCDVHWCGSRQEWWRLAMLCRWLARSRVMSRQCGGVRHYSGGSCFAGNRCRCLQWERRHGGAVLLSSLPDSWSGTVITVTSSAGSDGFTFEKIHDLIFGENLWRRSHRSNLGWTSMERFGYTSKRYLWQWKHGSCFSWGS